MEGAGDAVNGSAGKTCDFHVHAYQTRPGYRRTHPPDYTQQIPSTLKFLFITCLRTVTFFPTPSKISPWRTHKVIISMHILDYVLHCLTFSISAFTNRLRIYHTSVIAGIASHSLNTSARYCVSCNTYVSFCFVKSVALGFHWDAVPTFTLSVLLC